MMHGHDNGVGIDCGSGGTCWVKGAKGGNWDNWNSINKIYILNKNKAMHNFEIPSFTNVCLYRGKIIGS